MHEWFAEMERLRRLLEEYTEDGKAIPKATGPIERRPYSGLAKFLLERGVQLPKPTKQSPK